MLCFVHVRVLGLGCLIIGRSIELRIKPMIRDDRLCYMF